jgi:hypothetical protein
MNPVIIERRFAEVKCGLQEGGRLGCQIVKFFMRWIVVWVTQYPDSGDDLIAENS